MSSSRRPGLTGQRKEKLIQHGIERRVQHANPSSAPMHPMHESAHADIPEKYSRFDLHPGYLQLRIIADGAAQLGIGSPFFKNHDGIAGGRTLIGGRGYLNFSCYNYLGPSGPERHSPADKAAPAP